MILAGRILFGVLLALYPFAIYLCISSGNILVAALLLAATALLQAFSTNTKTSRICAVGACALAVTAASVNTELPVKFYPVIVNLIWLLVFSFSLAGESVIEKFAKLKEPQLSEKGRRYCRKVTVVWCVFFIINGSLALDSAINRSDVWWALYNGLIAYALIGLMFVVEWLVRRRIQKSN